MRLHAGPSITSINGFVIKPHNNNKHGCFLQAPTLHSPLGTLDQHCQDMGKQMIGESRVSTQVKNILHLRKIRFHVRSLFLTSQFSEKPKIFKRNQMLMFSTWRPYQIRKPFQ